MERVNKSTGKTMLKLLALIPLLFSSTVYAAYEWTFLGVVTKQTGIPEHILTFSMVGTFLILIGLIYRSKIAAVSNVVIPDKGITLRNVVEAYGRFIYNQCNAVIGEKDAPKYFQFIAILFILIFLSNVIGIVPGFLPPTELINTTLALGVFAFVYYNLVGCRELGVVEYIKHFAGPLWYIAFLVFPIEILSNLIRPFSLGLRLHGNMMGDHKVLDTFSNLEILGVHLSLIVPMPFFLFGLLICLIQAYVFTMLTMVYISLATAHHDHDEAHGH